MSETTVATYSQVVPATKTIIGSKVVNQQAEELGTIEDIVIDVDVGRIAYAVLSFGGFIGMGDKCVAIPWEAFRFNVTDKRATLNVDKKTLENAPGFDKDKWPNMTDSSWRNQVFSHYGYRPYGDELPTGSRHDRF